MGDLHHVSKGVGTKFAMCITKNRPMESHTPHVLLLTADKFEDTEVSYPLEVMQKEGWNVTIAAPSAKTLTGKHGLQLKPATTFSAIDPEKFDVLLLPGGKAPSIVRKDRDAIKVVKHFMSSDKIVAAICHGPQILASADVVRGRHLTSYTHEDVPEEIRYSGGIWEDSEVVIDSNLITSRNKRDLPAFMRETVSAVNEWNSRHAIS